MPDQTPAAPQLSTICPSCGRHPRQHSRVDGADASPRDGDVSFCWRCTALSIYQLTPLGVLVLRPPTVEEELQLQRDPEIALALSSRQAHPHDPLAAVAAAAEQLREAAADRPGDDSDA